MSYWIWIQRRQERQRTIEQRKVYLQLYEAMEALVHICRDGCRTIGPHDKVLKENQTPCNFEACKGLQLLLHHFAVCKFRVPGGCIHCKRMWQLLELHSRLCSEPEECKVPLCRCKHTSFLSSLLVWNKYLFIFLLFYINAHFKNSRTQQNLFGKYRADVITEVDQICHVLYFYAILLCHVTLWRLNYILISKGPCEQEL